MALGTVLGLVVVMAVPPLRDAALGLTGRMVLAAASPLAPDVDELDALPTTSRVLAGDGTLLAELNGGEKRQVVRLDTLPDHVVRAVLAAEDARFYQHGGVDPTAVFRAAVKSSQGNLQGGSTITQQLAKINYTEGERTVFRKLRELLYASRLEREYSKDALLERYLNQVYFGDGAYGIGSAARRFFGIAPAQLTAAQAATLAGKIRAPEALDPRKRPDRVVARRNQVLANMAKNGWLKGAELAEARREQLTLAPPPAPLATMAPHFVELVKREAATLDALGGSPEARSTQLFTGGYAVETTLDPRAMAAAAEAASEQLGADEDPSASIVSVAPGDGAVKALYEGPDSGRSFDVASLGRRQPGSAFKPFVYLAALRAGISPESTFEATSPMTFSHRSTGRFTVENYEGRSQGRITVDAAMVDSVNTVFSQLALEVELDNVVDVARELGISADIEPYPSVALGGLTEGVSPLEMAAAYATFAARGTYAEPYAIRRIRDRDGKVVYEHEPRRRNVFVDQEVGVLNLALQDVVTRGTGRAAGFGRPVAGKTGTTQNYGDAWFVGYTPQLATAVWVGHPEKVVPMTDVHGIDVTGGSFPAALFSAVMRRAHEGLPVQELYTATPASLGLERLRSAPPTVGTPSTVSRATSSTVVSGAVVPQSSTTTTVPLRQQPPPADAEPTTTTTARPRETTTTTAPRQQTTTTTQPKGDASSASQSTTTTTTPP